MARPSDLDFYVICLTLTTDLENVIVALESVAVKAVCGHSFDTFAFYKISLLAAVSSLPGVILLS